MQAPPRPLSGTFTIKVKDAFPTDKDSTYTIDAYQPGGIALPGQSVSVNSSKIADWMNKSWTCRYVLKVVIKDGVVIRILQTIGDYGVDEPPIPPPTPPEDEDEDEDDESDF